MILKGPHLAVKRNSYFLKRERIGHTHNRQGKIVSTQDPNETVHAYDGLGQLAKDLQSHSGEVNPGTTPEVTYAHAAP